MRPQVRRHSRARWWSRQTPRLRTAAELCAMLGVNGAKSRRQQELDRGADELLCGVAERRADLRIREHNGAAFVDDDRRVGRELQKGSREFAGEVHWYSR